MHKKLPLAFTDIGEQQLKNIASAVRIYRIELHNNQNISPSQEKKRLSLPDKPSIAVLPFTNMSGDAEPRVLQRRHNRRHHHRVVAVL